VLIFCCGGDSGSLISQPRITYKIVAAAGVFVFLLKIRFSLLYSLIEVLKVDVELEEVGIVGDGMPVYKHITVPTSKRFVYSV